MQNGTKRQGVRPQHTKPRSFRAEGRYDPPSTIFNEIRFFVSSSMKVKFILLPVAMSALHNRWIKLGKMAIYPEEKL